MRIWALVWAAVPLLLAAGVSSLRGDADKETEGAEASAAEKALLDRLSRQGSVGGRQAGYVLYVRRVTGGTLDQPVLKRFDAHGEVDLVVSATEAGLKVDTRKSQLLIRMRQGEAYARDGTRASFDAKVVSLPLPALKEGK